MGRKRAFNLDSQTIKRFCVIRKNKSIPLGELKTWLMNNMKWFALIEHKNDIDPVTSEVIPIHYHFVGESSFNRKRLITEMNEFSEVFGFNTDGLEWDGYKSQILALQYLIHKNNPEKTQHNIDEVVLYGISFDEFKTLITADSDTGISFDFIFTLCNKCNNVVELLREIPPSLFKTHYQYIKVLWNSIHNGRMNEL